MSDKEIENAHAKMINLSKSVGFVNGAKWMRDKLQNQQIEIVNTLTIAKEAWETLAIATGEEGLLPEDVAYQAIINTLKKLKK